MSQLSLFGNKESGKSRSCQEAFPVSRSPMPDSDAARQMTATSGRKCSELYRNSGPLGCLLRMLLESSAWNSKHRLLKWKVEPLADLRATTFTLRYSHDKKLCSSVQSVTNLKRKTTKSSRLLFRLVPLKPRTKGAEFLLWATPAAADSVGSHGRSLRTDIHNWKQGLWPTPTACGNYNRKGASKNSGDGLATAVRMWPTPTANCHQNPGEHGQGGQNLVTEVYKRDAGAIPTTGQLNPTWVEWLMGFEPGWTDLNASETQ